MKRLALCLVLAALAGGCLERMTTRQDGPPWQATVPHPAPPPAPAPSPPATSRPPAPPVEPIAAEQVNEANARQQCEALQQELDREEQGGDGSDTARPR